MPPVLHQRPVDLSAAVAFCPSCGEFFLTFPVAPEELPERSQLNHQRVVAHESGRHSVAHRFDLRLVGAEQAVPDDERPGVVAVGSV